MLLNFILYAILWIHIISFFANVDGFLFYVTHCLYLMIFHKMWTMLFSLSFCFFQFRSHSRYTYEYKYIYIFCIQNSFEMNKIDVRMTMSLQFFHLLFENSNYRKTWRSTILTDNFFTGLTNTLHIEHNIFSYEMCLHHFIGQTEQTNESRWINDKL